MSELTNDEFRILYALLHKRLSLKTGDVTPLSDLHPGGIIGVSRGLRKDLEKFESEVAARAKAEFANNLSLEKQVRSDFGEDDYDKIEPSYRGGLNFGDSIKGIF